MRLLASVSITLLVVAGFSEVAAQNQAELTASKENVSKEITLAATKARVAVTPLLIRGFVNTSLNQNDVFAGVYKNVPKDIRVARVAQYLSAKDLANSETSLPASTIQDVGDFNWGYLTTEISYAPMRFEAPMEATLLRIESPVGVFDFSNAGEKIKPGMALVMPATDITATFDFGGKKAVWTGNPLAEILNISAARTSEGCEIFVRSKPSDATVYFNGKKWYRRTNTSSVRETGTWEVILKLAGYRDWHEKRQLGPGESWTIDTVLTKSP